MLISIGCDAPTPFTGCLPEYEYEYDHSLKIILYDYEGNRLLELGNYTYNRSEVQLYDENFNPLDIKPQNNGHIVLMYFFFPQRDTEPLHTPLNHTYYLYLAKDEIDTLQLSYSLAKDDCNDVILSSLKYTYNDSLYFEHEYPGKGYNATLEIVKP